MPSRLRPLLLLLLVVASSTGCYAGAHRGGVHVHSHHHHASGADVAIGAVGLIAAAAVIASADNDRPRGPEVVYVDRVVYVGSPPPPPVVLPASARDRVSKDEASPFDAKSARAALGGVDLAPCRAEGAPRGFGHAKVTFNPDGHASKVEVDTPSGLTDPAVKCIGDRLGATTVPEYEGSYVTVGTTWFVP